jgi:transcriptional regulator of acetoin/glycerol metabolism
VSALRERIAQLEEELRLARAHNAHLHSIIRVVQRAVGEMAPDNLPIDLAGLERIAVQRALEATGGHAGRAALKLGVARTTIFVMMKRHGLNAPGKAAQA